jgi:Raf kinase inhibitor-like YbhB/YbcL family protein
MELKSQSFDEGRAIPERFAFARFDPKDHFALSDNLNPHLAWSGAPAGTRSFALLCVDPDAPTVPDDVNREGRRVRADLARAEFVHWVLVDVPPRVSEIAEGSCSRGVVPKGKTRTPGPPGSRQGVNDYTGWFAKDPAMAGTYRGYDGPAPPWNDERVHRYRFELFALDLERTPVEADFDAAAVRRAIEGHVLARASLTGTYTLNPELRK